MGTRNGSSQQRREPLCINCRKRKRVSRGNCQVCLRYAHMLIETAQKTDEQLVAEGLLLKAMKAGRRSTVGSRLAKSAKKTVAKVS